MRFRWLKVEVSEGEKMMRIDNETRLNVLEKNGEKDFFNSWYFLFADQNDYGPELDCGSLATADDDATDFDE